MYGWDQLCPHASGLPMRLSTDDRRTAAGSSEMVFEIARTCEDFESALRLLYESYVRAGLAVRNPSGIRLTPYHLLNTTEVFVAKIRGEVVMTISLIADGELGLPMEAMYANEIEELRTLGKRVAEVGCFADRRLDVTGFSPAFNTLTKLLVQTARHRGQDTLVVAVHPRHAKFYRRLLGFQDIGGLAYCEYVSNRPAVALLLDLTQQHGTKQYNAFAQDPFPVSALQTKAFDQDTMRYFHSLLDVTLIQFNNAELDPFARPTDQQKPPVGETSPGNTLPGELSQLSR